MQTVSQGDILRLEKSNMRILVLSKDFFNRTGMTVVCPVTDNTSPDALHLPVETDGFTGTAMLEHLKSMDLRSRFYAKLGSVSFEQIQEISDAVQSIFEYYPCSAL